MNPEFRRYLWMELTAQRMVVMPAVIAALLWLAYLLDGGGTTGISAVSLWLYGALALLWGTRSASESVLSEIAAHTWDGQRMSSLEPWDMTWAKLFGSTVYVWYGCALLGAAFIAVELPKDPAHALGRLALVTAAAVIAHAISLLASLHAVHRRASDVPARGASHFSIGVLAAVPFIMFGNGAAATGQSLVWFGAERDAFAFSVLSCIAFALWAVLGVYMLMRLELQRRNPPWPWLAFVGFVAAWAAGFAHDRVPGLAEVAGGRPDVTAAQILVALVVSAVLFYCTLLVEPKNPVEFRRLARDARAGHLARAAAALPRWLVTYAVAVALGLALVAMVATLGGGRAPGAAAAGVVLAGLGFMARDAALLVALNLSPRPRRADAAGLLYLLVLYGLAPAILAGLGLERLRPLFVPTAAAGITGAVVAAAQAVLFAGFAAARWRSYRRRITGAAGAPIP